MAPIATGGGRATSLGMVGVRALRSQAVARSHEDNPIRIRVLAPMTFRVGQKVVCIDARPKPGYYWASGEALVKGQVYTVLSVHTDDENYLALWLVEVSRCEGAIAEHGPKAGYDIRRFRPIVKPKRSASTEVGMTILHKIRMGIREPEDV